MIWYSNLYTSDNIHKKVNKYRQKINHGESTVGIYVICISNREDEELTIYPSKELRKPYFDREHAVIIGMVRGYDEALTMIEMMTQDVYDETGDCKLKDYFINKMELEK